MCGVDGMRFIGITFDSHMQCIARRSRAHAIADQPQNAGAAMSRVTDHPSSRRTISTRETNNARSMSSRRPLESSRGHTRLCRLRAPERHGPIDLCVGKCQRQWNPSASKIRQWNSRSMLRHEHLEDHRCKFFGLCQWTAVGTEGGPDKALRWTRQDDRCEW